MPEPATTPAAPPAGPLLITQGECWVFFAFDLGNSVDLEEARRRMPAARGPGLPAARGQHGTRPGLQFRPEPFRLAAPAEPVSIGGGEHGGWATTPGVDVALFDFGAVSLAYRIELKGVGWAELQRLAVALDESRALEQDARRRAEALLGPLGPAVRRPNFADIVEDYVVFRAHAWTFGGSPGPAAAITRHAAGPLAQVLRANPTPLSAFEVEDAMSCALGFEPADLTVIDWKAAMVFDPDAADILAVLEFANVELLEMRFLDDRLDGVLDRSYPAAAPGARRSLFRGRTSEERRRIATLQMENALLFEGINNAIKLVGDQYLSRVYRAATKRFHLPEWDASVLRKLETLQNLYEKLADAQSTRRMEVLEWIIIVLIAASIVLPFVTPGSK